MPTKEMTKRDAKVVQYLNDAYATERRLEIALEAHIDLLVFVGCSGTRIGFPGSETLKSFLARRDAPIGHRRHEIVGPQSGQLIYVDRRERGRELSFGGAQLLFRVCDILGRGGAGQR